MDTTTSMVGCGGGDANALIQRPALDAGTKSIDPSDDFMPRNARPADGKERFDGGRIRVADPTRFDANTHLIGAWIHKWLSYFRELSGLREFDGFIRCLHGCSVRSLVQL
jgi:hypothetical protein